MGGEIPPSGVKMKKYLILQDTIANKEKVKAGDVVELSPEEGHSLCGYKKAEEYTGKKSKTKDRSIGLEKSEEKPKKRSKK